MSNASPALGKVYLVGAGPGHPGLVTVRAMQLLRRADLILYDKLAPKSLLDKLNLKGLVAKKPKPATA